ncbi:MAG: tryptophan synthase subunit alpha [Parcubacteria group bacterium]|nr:tryptophan synthase subunit alpha [Parcubacteria group bacterium]
MNTIAAQLQKIQAENRLGLMTHIVVGYPTLDESRALVVAMAEAGADFIELQIPFSDPLADGPTLMQANQIALDGGVTVRAAMELMAELAPRVGIPLIFMTYFNIIHHYGVERFCADAAGAGARGLIVPDIPLDEEPQEHFISASELHKVTAVRLLSPASTERRLKLNAGLAKDFVYFVSRKGTTGAQSEFDPELQSHLKKVKQFITVPLAVGFGISKPEHLEVLKGHAEVAVIGSAMVNVYNQAEPGKGVEAVRGFLSDLVQVRNF